MKKQNPRNIGSIKVNINHGHQISSDNDIKPITDSKKPKIGRNNKRIGPDD